MSYLEPGEGGALRAASRAHRDRVHFAMLGIAKFLQEESCMDCFFGEQEAVVDSMAILRWFSHLLLGPHLTFEADGRRRPLKRTTAPSCAGVPQVHPRLFATVQDWIDVQFIQCTYDRVLDSVYRLPVKYMVGNKARWRNVKALVY